MATNDIHAVDDRYSFSSNDTLSGNILANDAPGANGAAFLRFFDGVRVGAKSGLDEVTIVEGDYGSFRVKPDGSFTYALRPDVEASLLPGQVLTESLSYKISDGAGKTDVGRLTMSVTGASPLAIDDSVVASENGPIAGNLLDNDSAGAGGDKFLRFVDGVRIDAKAAGSDSTDVAGQYGTFTFKPDGSFTYQLDPAVAASLGEGETVVEKLSYKMSNGRGATDVGVLTLTVNGAGEVVENAAPVAVADAVTVSEDGSATIDFSDLLANDTDADGDSLTIANVDDSATLGSVSVTPSGVAYSAGAAFQYLQAGETATDSFTYTVSDGNGGTSSTTVEITVEGANDGPVVSDDSAFVTAGETVIIPALANDTDPEGNALTITGVTDPANGTVTINPDGTLSYTPGADFAGEDSFTYTVTDSFGASSTGTVSLVVGISGHVTVGGDVFLQGNFMEIGISSSGSLGTENAAPEGFHPTDSEGRISYVVDPDGWVAGEPAQAGDFTLPGSPVDTIVLGIGGTSYVQDERSGRRDIDTVTTDTSDASSLSATTTGSVAGVNFSQKIELDPNATYYTTTITVTNTTGAAIDDVRFMRSFDPDQDYDFFGNYETFNDVLSQPAGGNDIAVARATGAESGVSVNLVSFDQGARASNFGFDNYDVYNPQAYDAPVDSDGALDDEAITMTFDIGTLAPGQTVTKVFYTSLNGTANANDMTIGTDGDDVLNSGAGDDILLGLAGDDILTGGAGDDIFIFSAGFGDDTITDFVAGIGTDDVIELRGLGASYDSFAKIRAASSQVGDDVVIDLGASSLTLLDVNVSALSADDFVLV